MAQSSTDKIKEFYSAVLSMRSAQQNYFKLRASRAAATALEAALSDSKKKEKLVDHLLENFNQIELL